MSSVPQYSAERRVSVRWQSTQKTSCHFATLEKITSRWAVIINVSRHGIGLRLPFALEPGHEVLIEFPSKSAGSDKVAAAFVVHSNPVDGEWAVGCTLHSQLEQEELDALL